MYIYNFVYITYSSIYMHVTNHIPFINNVIISIYTIHIYIYNKKCYLFFLENKVLENVMKFFFYFKFSGLSIFILYYEVLKRI